MVITNILGIKDMFRIHIKFVTLINETYQNFTSTLSRFILNIFNCLMENNDPIINKKENAIVSR